LASTLWLQRYVWR